jgi:hypothetical protein
MPKRNLGDFQSIPDLAVDVAKVNLNAEQAH